MSGKVKISPRAGREPGPGPAWARAVPVAPAASCSCQLATGEPDVRRDVPGADRGGAGAWWWCVQLESRA